MWTWLKKSHSTDYFFIQLENSGCKEFTENLNYTSFKYFFSFFSKGQVPVNFTCHLSWSWATRAGPSEGKILVTEGGEKRRWRASPVPDRHTWSAASPDHNWNDLHLRPQDLYGGRPSAGIQTKTRYINNDKKQKFSWADTIQLACRSKRAHFFLKKEPQSKLAPLQVHLKKKLSKFYRKRVRNHYNSNKEQIFGNSSEA